MFDRRITPERTKFLVLAIKKSASINFDYYTNTDPSFLFNQLFSSL